MKKVQENVYEIENSDILELFKERIPDAHKGMYGTVGILGGSLEYSGAIKLANMSASAMRSGCGVVRLIVPKDIASSIAPYLVEQTIYPITCDPNSHMTFNKEELTNSLKKITAIAVGMGWGKSKNYPLILKELLTTFKGPIVIDADGLNTLAQMDLNILLKTKNQVIITPHLKELSRLTDLKTEQIKQNPLNIAKKIAKKYHLIVLLKGQTTIITDGNLTYLSKTGVPGMATAGSGDVLSGIIIGMLGYNQPNLLTIAASSYLAGLAGSIAQNKNTDISLIASDTINSISDAIKYIRTH